MSQTQEEYLRIFLADVRLHKRDDEIQGCVSCPSTNPSCNCKSGETCKQVSRTCETCPQIKCISSSSSKNVGGIVGGIVGGLVFLALIIAFIVWNRRKHNKSNRLLRLEAQDKEILDASGGGDYKDAIDLGAREHNASMGGLSREDGGLAPPGGRRHYSRSPGQTSSLYSGSRGRYGKSRRNSYRNSTSTFSSMASSALSRASNIIPIAYIPGVKVKSGASFYSNRQVVDDAQSLNSESERRGVTTFGSPLSTMTAVRAVPKLVDINKPSKLANEVIFEDTEEPATKRDSASVASSDGQSFKGAVSKSNSTRKHRRSVNGLTHIVEASETTSDINDMISLGADSEEEDDDEGEPVRYSRRYPSASTSDRNSLLAGNRPSSSILLDIDVDRSPLNPFDDSFEHK